MSDELYDLLKTEFAELREEYKLLSADGLTVRELFKLLTSFMGRSVNTVKHLGEHRTPEERRECIVVATEEFFAEVVEPWNIPWVPDWLEKMVVDPSIKRGIRPVVEGIYDGLETFLT